ncbi:MAG: type II toxin-antitoxin system HigB family toxin [Nitrosomonadales bacterium]|nr:type II toxin-antitoxin system HigB family toxin [Nitrosomonadales bacterium]
MRILALSTLRAFWEAYPQARMPLSHWYAEASSADWATPDAIKAAHRNASFLADNRVVFNIKGNDYRLIVKVHYNRRMMFVRFVGTHEQYDAIDAERI